MKLMVASWNNGGADWNAEAEETALLSYNIQHQFGLPAQCTIVLADPTGAVAQKYNVDPNDVYIGAGKATLEDPTGTDLFYGRIIKARHDSKRRQTRLVCEDWMSQLGEDRITYDMRQDLDGSGLRQSTVLGDANVGGTPYRHISRDPIASAQAADGAVYTDETDEARDDTADDMTLLPAAPAIGDCYYFGFSSTTSSIKIDHTTNGDGSWTLQWQFWDGAAWQGLPGLSGNLTLRGGTGVRETSWTIPGDWATTTINGVGPYYYMRIRVSGFTNCVTAPKGGYAYRPRSRVYDDAMTWAGDAFNDKFLVFTSGMAGDITLGVAPDKETVTAVAGIDTDSKSGGNFYWDDDEQYHVTVDNDESWDVVYEFPIWANTSTRFDSLNAARLVLVYKLKGTTANTATINVYNNDVAIADYVEIGNITAYDVATEHRIIRTTITIPAKHLPDVLDDDGYAKIKLAVSWAAGTVEFYVYYVRFEVDISTEGVSAAYDILDTETNYLLVDADLTADGVCIPPETPYCIVDYLYTHINGIVTGYDPVVTMTSSVESTTGISTRHYEERTALDILQDLADMDGAVVWCALGGAQVTWKATFNAGAPASLGDSGQTHTTMAWVDGEYDYEPMMNEAHVYGIRIGDSQLARDSSTLATDPGATSKAKYKATRSDVVRSTGGLSQHEVDELAESIVTRDANVQLFLQCEIAGLNSLRLASEVAVTSTYLSLTAANYVVTGWSYDSSTYKTVLRLAPRSSTGYQKHLLFGDYLRHVSEKTTMARVDTYAPSLSSQEWS